jgi:xanthine dehydrogenase accessory factor
MCLQNSTWQSQNIRPVKAHMAALPPFSGLLCNDCPMIATAELDEILRLARDWEQAGRRVALATVVETWGSAPRPAGSMLLCDEAGSFVGSVSGGCVEVSVIETARDVIAQQRPRLLEFGLEDSDVWTAGLACGGRIRVYVQRPLSGIVERMTTLRAEKQPYVLATWLQEGRQEIFAADGTHVPAVQSSAAAGSARAALPLPGDARFAEQVSQALQSDRAFAVPADGEEVFLLPVNPKLRLIVVGAVHIAEPLVRMAAMMGYEVTLIDPRAAFAERARFEDARVLTEWPAAALTRLTPDHRTAVVVLSHDPKIDDPALGIALASDAFYVGALGSVRTHQRRLERLQEAGAADSALARIRGPVGLRIGAKSPAEIAISVLAEMTATLRQSALAGRM